MDILKKCERMTNLSLVLFCLCVLIVVLNCLDASLTVYGLSLGNAQESNPLVTINRNTITLKLLLGFTFSILLNSCGILATREKNGTVFYIVLFVALIITAYLSVVVINNLMVIKESVRA